MQLRCLLPISLAGDPSSAVLCDHCLVTTMGSSHAASQCIQRFALMYLFRISVLDCETPPITALIREELSAFQPLRRPLVLGANRGGKHSRGLSHGLQAVKYSQLAASRSPVRGTPMIASSAAAQSPSVQVDFSPVMRVLPRVLEPLMPAAGSAAALVSCYSVRKIHMVEPLHLTQ